MVPRSDIPRAGGESGPVKKNQTKIILSLKHINNIQKIFIKIQKKNKINNPKNKK
jgi:hypothetical protein